MSRGHPAVKRKGTMLKEYLLKKALDVAFDYAKKALRKTDSKLITTREELEESVNLHLRSVNSWSTEVSFSDLKSAKLTSEIFIDLGLYVYPRHIRMGEEIETIPLLSIFGSNIRHIVLLGHPGAGKTTSMKFLCQELFHNDNFPDERFSFPLLIKLRELHDSKLPASSMIIDSIYNILGLRLDFFRDLKKSEAKNERRAVKDKLVINVLEGLGVLLILDGFDELVEETRFRGAIKEIRYLATHLERARMVVTSRTGDFKYRIDNTVQYEITPLTKDQIGTFARKWLADEESASDFIAKVYESPFADTAIRPLTLAHLCAIYERIGKIPDKPKTIYRKIIGLLLEEWDQQRSVKRESKYAHFEADRKFEFLSQLAYVLTTSLQSTVFSERDLINVYDRIHENFDLVASESRQVISELESHTGLLLESGYQQFEFAHKSLQEFLTAEHLVKLPSIPTQKKVLLVIPNELAIAVTISSSPSDYFSELVLERLLDEELSEGFVGSFLSRLFLEKPDFNTSTNLGLALVILYSLYIEWNVVSGDQLKLFYYDAIFNEFERILRIVLRRSSIDFIKQYYKTNHIFDMEDGNHLHRLVRENERIKIGPRKQRIDKLPNNMTRFPQTLYLRNSLLTNGNTSDSVEGFSEIPF